MPFLKKTLLPVLLVLGSLSAMQAQQRCGTVEYEALLKQLNPSRESSEDFEKWMKQKITALKAKLKSGTQTQSITYTIPVVVHIIHNGEPVGTGTNIPDAQVFSQIDRINTDFPRMNADTTNTPAEFKSVAGKININFVLAKQDPEGLATNGIVRVKGPQTSYALSDNATFKSLSYWPAENYLNIWVVNFVDPAGIVGFAQLPVSSLAGLSDASKDRLTDGVAIHYKTFGEGEAFNIDPDLNKGRTATHEIGHIFGLLHIWGLTTSCAASDFCNDTPTQYGPTYGCPSQPADSGCGNDKMFQNYMDYTNDECYNLFTQDQVARMYVVLGNSPRRASLLESPGATPPMLVANNLGLRKIISPNATACPEVNIPTLQIRNYGNTSVTSAKIQLTMSGGITETKDFTFSPALAPVDTAVVTFSPVSLAPENTYSISFDILQTNGGTDGNPANDTLSQTITVQALTTLPLSQTFNTTPSDWRIANPDGELTWENILAPNDDPDNTAMYVNFYNYQNIGEQDQLISPVFSLPIDTAAVLKFDWSYASFPGQDNDRLRILVTTDCDFSHAVEVFNETGDNLATALATTNSYVPQSSADWATQTISLLPFAGQQHVQVAFVATNDYGNNLYVDNVGVVKGNFSDLTLIALKSPSPVTCESNPIPVITLQNNGSSILTDILVTCTINNIITTQEFSGISLGIGQTQDFSLNAWSLMTGNNVVRVNIQDIENVDINSEDNTLRLYVVVNASQDIIPIRQNFDTSYPDWTEVSPTRQTSWVLSSTLTNRNNALVYNAYNNPDIGSQAWLVSPVLDFSKALKSSMLFDLSYVRSSTGSERLQVFTSTDCGRTFPNIVFDQSGSQLELKDTVSDNYWKPQKNKDWGTKYVDLNTLIGNPNARIAFVVTDADGNNLYLDNVQIFIDDDASPLTINNQYSVYNNYQPNFKITFNLPVKQQVRMQIYSSIGQVVLDNELSDVLNQTYDVDLTGQGSGIYIVRLQIGNQFGIAKVFVGN